MSEALRSLADAARAVTAAATDDDVLAIVAQAARDVIGARQGVARRDANGAPHGPRLVAPLIARDGSSLGLIELWDKDGEFTPDDEAIVIQLAQMAANAIETLELLAREHAARVEAEETGRRLLLEKQRAEALQRVGIGDRRPPGPAGDRPARHRRRPRAHPRRVRRVLLQRDLRRRRGVHALHALRRRAQRVRALPDAAQHRDLRAHVRRRGDRPARRRPGRPALRPQRALPRHAGGPSAGPQLPRGAGHHLRRRGRGRAVLRPPGARHVLRRGRAHGRGDRGAVGDRDRERAPVPGAHAHGPDAAARAAAAASPADRGARAGRRLPRRRRGQRGRRRLLRRLPAGRRKLGAGRRRRLRQGPAGGRGHGARPLHAARARRRRPAAQLHARPPQRRAAAPARARVRDRRAGARGAARGRRDRRAGDRGPPAADRLPRRRGAARSGTSARRSGSSSSPTCPRCRSSSRPATCSRSTPTA